MATEITMPQMGFDMTEGVIANWLKAEGDTVKKGDAIAEIETDKTTIQIEAFSGGVLSKIIAPAGAKVPPAWRSVGTHSTGVDVLNI